MVVSSTLQHYQNLFRSYPGIPFGFLHEVLQLPAGRLALMIALAPPAALMEDFLIFWSEENALNAAFGALSWVLCSNCCSDPQTLFDKIHHYILCRRFPVFLHRYVT